MRRGARRPAIVPACRHGRWGWTCARPVGGAARRHLVGFGGSLGVYDDEEVVDEYRLGYSATTAAEPAFCFVGLRVAAAFGGAVRVRWRRRVPHWRHGWGGGGECHACKWRSTAAPWRQPLCRPVACDRLLGARRGGWGAPAAVPERGRHGDIVLSALSRWHAPAPSRLRVFGGWPAGEAVVGAAAAGSTAASGPSLSGVPSTRRWWRTSFPAAVVRGVAHVRLCLRRGGAVLHCRCRTTLTGKVVDARPASVGGVGAGRGAAALHSDKRQADAVSRQRRRGGRDGRRAGCRASGAVAVRAAGVPASSGIHPLKRRRVGRRPRRRGRRGEDSEALLQ